MAVTADRVVVELQAQTDSYLRNIKNAEQQFANGLDRIEAEAAQAGSALATVATRGQQAFVQAASQAPQAAQAIGGARLQTANLAAQLNDIAVTLASGQSPFLVAVQQGSQINQVIGQAGAAGAVRMLGSAFASLISPVNLATFGIIALGGVAVQYFSQLLSDSANAEETLKEQASLINRVADRWGKAYPALKEYADQLERTKQASEAVAATQIQIDKSLENVRASTGDLVNKWAALSTGLSLGQNQQQIDAVNDSLQTLRNALADGTVTAEQARRVYDALLNLSLASGISVVGDLAAEFGALSLQIDGAVESIGRINNQLFEGIENTLQGIDKANEKFIADQEHRNSLTAEQLRLENEIARVKAEAERAGGFLDDATARGLAAANIAADGRRNPRRPARDQSAEAAQRERQAVQDLIAQLEFEHSLIGMTAAEKEKAVALRRAGSAATDEERDRIAGLTEQIYNETTALREQQQAYEQLRQIGVDAINGIATAFADGKLEAEELIHIAARLLEQLISMKSVSGSGGGLFDFLGSLFGGGSDPWAGLRIPGYANGTNYHPGGLAIVGERGPELLNLPRGSQVIPKMPSSSGAAAGGPSIVNINIDVTGARGNAEIMDMVQAGVAKGIDQWQKTPQFALTVGRAAQNSIRTGQVR
jgi:CRISPR/Cas system CSM-associated protein Csm2 small subunit